MVNREIEVMAAFVHGGLAFGHALGLFFNVRKGNKIDATIHGLALCYDAWATHKHWVDAAPKKNYQLEADRIYAKDVHDYANCVRTVEL